ncbi:MAG: homoserine O-acetyltransferase [Gordonia sp. (in: high G+C Gram-positive bacteria)]
MDESASVSAAEPVWAQTPDGSLHQIQVGDIKLDGGETIPDVTMAFSRWGKPNAARDNVVLVLHALTADTYITGPADEKHAAPGWWDGLVGPGAALDTDEWCVIAANVLGGCSGSTGPSSPAPDGKPWGSRFPTLTVLDQVRAEATLLDELGVTSLAAAVGGSMGGARALEWAITYPDRTRAALVLAVGARATADQIGTQTTQIAAIKADPAWQGGDYHGTGQSPTVGMGVARRIAHLTYRNELELDNRFANSPQGQEDPLHDGRYAVQSYLDHQANKIIARFDPASYVALTEVLNNHDVGRGRGGVPKALASCTTPVIVGGIDSDRLYPLRLQEELAAGLGNCVGGLRVVESVYGHDAFLIEFDAMADLLRQTVALARR